MNQPHKPTAALDLKSALLRYFGYDSFRPRQLEIIQHTMAGNDALVIMPTGGGKSLCYQLPAIVMDGMALVISPLIALMRDQVLALRANGVKAAAVNSSVSRDDLDRIYQEAEAGELKLLYVSPEKAMTAGFIDYIRGMRVSLIAIDEAHCVSIWGNDFRPEYAALGHVVQQFPDVPVLALTATADRATQTDIVKQLGLRNAKTYLSSFERENIFINAENGQERLKKIFRFLDGHRGESGIVYCLSRKSTQEMSEKLRNRGFKADYYNAELTAQRRRQVQDAFQQGSIQIVCATIAFGMGIDKSDIRWVIHYNMPKNVESFYQEIGRSGRDGDPAESLMFFSFRDVTVYRGFIENSDAQEAFKEVQQQKLDRIWELAQATSCRTNVILNYFGEYRNKGCGHCDNCQNPPEGFDGTVLALKALSASRRTHQRVGMHVLVDILRGSMRQEIRAGKYDQIKTFGAGRDLSRRDWIEYITQMINQGLFEIDYTQQSQLRCTPIGELVLRGEMTITLHKKVMVDRASVKKVSKKEQFEEGLMDALKECRKTFAASESVPAYLVFSDRTLREIAAAKPVTVLDLVNVHGVGEFKAKKYGEMFMQIVRDYTLKQTHVKKPKGKTYLVTLQMLRDGHSADEIARDRGLAIGTVYTHLAHLYERGEQIDLHQYFAPGDLETIRKAWEKAEKPDQLAPVKALLPESLDFHQIRMAIAIFKKSDTTIQA